MITLLRVLFGFVVACLVAGLVTVAFVVTPADIAGLPADAQPERLGNAGVLSLLAATHSAIFAFPFAIIAIGIAEMSVIRSRLYYAFVGVGIALGGLAAEYANEVGGQPSILNGYALAAYVAVGLAGGLAYWLVAGRRAGGKRRTQHRPRWPRRPILNRLHSRTELSPVSHAQLCCCIAAIGLAFCVMLAGARRSHADAGPGPPATFRQPLHRCCARVFGRQHGCLRRLRRAGARTSGRPYCNHPAPSRRRLRNCGTGLCPWRRPRRHPRPSSTPSIHSIGCCRQRRRPARPRPPCRPIPGKPCRRSPTL